jgi:hypothetical protein
MVLWRTFHDDVMHCMGDVALMMMSVGSGDDLHPLSYTLTPLGPGSLYIGVFIAQFVARKKGYKV